MRAASAEHRWKQWKGQWNAMQHQSQKNSDPGDLVLANAVDFLNAGLDILFAKTATSREAKVGVTSIQTAVELLAKYRLIRERGLESIVRGKLPPGDLLEAARNGHMRTIGYGECLKVIEADEGFSELEAELVGRVQQLRNTLVHFAAEVDVVSVRNDVAWLLIRALGMFAAGQDRDSGEMKTHEQFLTAANFYLLTNFKPYRDEAVDSALDSLDSEEVFRCWSCLNDSMSLRTSDNYFCHCCGIAVDLDVVAYTDCTLCSQENGICFDPLNFINGLHYGKCLYCNTVVGVARCSECERPRSQLPDAVVPITCDDCIEA